MTVSNFVTTNYTCDIGNGKYHHPGGEGYVKLVRVKIIYDD